MYWLNCVQVLIRHVLSEERFIVLQRLLELSPEEALGVFGDRKELTLGLADIPFDGERSD